MYWIILGEVSKITPRLPDIEAEADSHPATDQGDRQGCTPGPTNPVMGNPYISPMSRGYLWVSYPQESLQNTTNSMGTLLGVHPSLSLDTIRFLLVSFLTSFSAQKVSQLSGFAICSCSHLFKYHKKQVDLLHHFKAPFRLMFKILEPPAKKACSFI